MSDRTTRDHILEAADRLFYRQGYETTSFADLANDVGISRGNFYHHFPTKTDVLGAVLELRLVKTEAMLRAWAEASEDPVERLRSFVRLLFENRAPIARYGCPVGTMCVELAKLGHESRGSANRILGVFVEWLADRFRELRCDAPEALAKSLFARTQGIAVVAQATGDEEFLVCEVRALEAWLDEVVGGPRAGVRSRVSSSRRKRKER